MNPKNTDTKIKRTISPAHIAALQKGRRAALEDGLTPQQVGKEKAAMALDWIYRFGWASPTMLDAVSGTERGALAAKLVRKGLLLRERTPSGGSLADVPAYVLMLTELGVSEVMREIDDEKDVYPYAPRYQPALLRHDYIVQRLTQSALAEQKIRRFKPDRLLRLDADGTSAKVPDVEWFWGLRRVFVEVELSAKFARELDEFIRKTGDQLDAADKAAKAANSSAPPAVVLIVSDSKGLLTRYAKHFAPGATAGVWNRNESGHWIRTGSWEVPAWMSERVLFRHIDDPDLVKSLTL